MNDIDIKQHLPKTMHKYIKRKPEVTKTHGDGFAAYHGMSGVDKYYYVYKNGETHTKMFPALVNRVIGGKPVQISVIIHY